MKNVRDSQIKKCFFFTEEEFKEIFVELFGEYDEDTNEVDIEIDLIEGIYFCGISNQDVYTKLSEYFDVEVTSVHSDSCQECIGIWIVYKDKTETKNSSKEAKIQSLLKKMERVSDSKEFGLNYGELSNIVDEIQHVFDCNHTFTAFLYESDGKTASDFTMGDSKEDVIEFAIANNYDEVVNDYTGEILWKNKR
jgi:uncharacterized pyridoxamine 5'-phosphate oxidase family protein